MSNYKNSIERYQQKFPEAEFSLNPRYAEIWARQKEKQYIDRVVVLPEMPSDNPIRMQMEIWGFQLVARVYAESVTAMTFKGFHNKPKDDSKEDGTWITNLYGEQIEREDGEALSLNCFMFKNFDMKPVKAYDSDKKEFSFVKDQDQKLVIGPVGYISEVSFYHAEDEASTERLLKIKNCCLPLMLRVKGLQKIAILKSRKSNMFTVNGEFLYKTKVNINKLIDAKEAAKINQPIEETKPGFFEKFEPATIESSENPFASSGADDLPF